ncbi:Hypothetical protein, putative [Bodo saltans]|uniref:Uncharacterized protein n=1 Tax=Bodo saltans TaxID=75058 RepID=A0A0S4JAA7_BODSA|nr:Hypothetical protein, putative [Bodo saltans]|eukprot:CUG81226.1 Hypothetical protein, putative [Bodo saltans]
MAYLQKIMPEGPTWAVEPISGLPIDPIDQLPRGLKDTLLRNQQGVAPVVLFVEWACKLSEGGAQRGAKERLIVVTPDSVNVYSSDGGIKRRVGISEVAKLYVELPTEGSQPHGGQHNNALFTGCICFEVPRQFDMCFDIRRDSVARCRHAIMRCVRVLCTLHRCRSSNASRPLQVTELREGSLGAHQGSELAYFRLKKAHAAGPHPHGKKGPLLPPVLPLVTEAMEREAEDNVEGQLAQAVIDVTREVQRFKETNSALPSRQGLSLLERYVARLRLCEQEQLRVAQKKVFLTAKANRQTARMTTLESAMGEARRQYVAEAQELDQVRATHDTQVQQLRSRIDNAALQQRTLANESQNLHTTFLNHVRHIVEPERVALEATIASLRAELSWRRASLPQRSSLVEETQMLQGSLEQLKGGWEAHRILEEQLNEAQELWSVLSKENLDLEQQVSTALSSLREAKQKQQTHLAQVSLSLARRSNLARTLDERRKAVTAMRDAVEEWTNKLPATVQEERYMQLKLDVRHMEDIVSEDLERKITMHHSLARSAVQTLSEQISLAESKEQILRDKLKKLRTNRQPSTSSVISSTTF